MRLKRLHVQGYKTFATKTEFLFPAGITAIVGPNGSGKSNIADAVRWVLGEQRYSTLRGKRTEDMIFSGSQNRARAGMAEVELALDNSDSWLPVDYSEVTLSRRAYRDGQNEYRLNNNRVRLRDVNELLSQSGLSHRTYTIIGQGVVDAVLSLHAQERRGLFEEAAGISHYRDKRSDAIRKLDETQRNLERVRDIIAEIEPRLKRLERQAERTREHDDLSRGLEQQLRVWYGYSWREATTTLDRAQRMASERLQQYEERLNNAQEVTEDIDRIRQELSDLRLKLGAWHAQSSVLHSQAEERQRELAVLSERSRQLSAQRDQHLAEIGALDERRAGLAQRAADIETVLAGYERILAEREAEASSAQSALNARLADREGLSVRRLAASERLNALRTDAAQLRSRRDTLAERVETLVGQTHTERAELKHLQDELASRSTQTTRIEAELGRLVTELEQASNIGSDLDEQRTILAERMARKQRDLRQMREEEADVAARFELLSQLRQDFAAYGTAARTLLGSSDGTISPVPGILGVLAQMIQIPDDHSLELTGAIEAALGVYAGALVVEDWRAAARALRFLRSSDATGRVVFLALDALASPAQPVTFRGWSPLAHQVDCDEVLRPIVDRLLGQAYVVRDLGTAHSALPHLPLGALLVTLEGDAVRKNGTIEGGRPAQHTRPLVQEHEWSRLRTHRIELGARRESVEAMVGQMQVALDKFEMRIQDNRGAADRLRARHAAADGVRAKLAKQAEFLQQEGEWRLSKLEHAEADKNALVQRQNELEDEIAELTRTEVAVTAELDEIVNSLQSLPTDKLRQQLTEAQMALAAVRQAQLGQQDILMELETDLSQLATERETRLRRVTALEEEGRSADERSAWLAEQQVELNSGLEGLTDRIKPAEVLIAELVKEQKHLESTERLERARLREFENNLTVARLDVQRREDALEQLRSRIEEDFGLVELELGPNISVQTPLPLHPLVSKLPVVQRLPDGVEAEIKRLRAQLRRLGAINPNAPSDYDEALQRFSFLSEQSSDLARAIASLRQVISEMDGLIEHAFRQTFEAVTSEFSKTFTNLFDGGHARLELSDPNDLTQTGVEMVAQPPGKRMQPLASLSGGERALTAVALIFAILKVSPTPFCILDEVDAMLDAANIGRFRAQLELLAQHTQFVVITHNRGTITAADTVYGVSMGADSVSQVYSIQLDGEKIKEA